MPSDDEFNSALKELEDSNDRAVGIVGATLIELALQEAIERRLLPMSNNHRKALFGSDDGYTFSRKIELGFSLGLFGNQTKADLSRIKSIRNEFAHNLDRKFGHKEIAKQCGHLTDYRKEEPLSEEVLSLAGERRDYLISREWRWRFIFAIMHIHAGLMKEGFVVSQPPKATFLA